MSKTTIFSEDGEDSMVVSIEDIGPQEAQEILGSRNSSNRPVSKVNQAKITKALTSGEWKLNGTPIRFDSDGTLLDGQHRLHAVVSSGIPIRTLVVRSLPKEVFDTIDTGRIRSCEDILDIGGHKQARALAPVANALYHYERYKGGVGVSLDKFVTLGDRLRVIKENPGLQESITEVWRSQDIVGTSPSVRCAMHYLLSKIDKAAASDFIQQVMKGTGISEDDPAYVLRQMFSKRASYVKVPGYQRLCFDFAMYIKAWNAYRAGSKIKFLRFNPGSEAFPIIQS